MKAVMNVNRNYAYLFVGLLILVGGMFAVNALNSDDPELLGHTRDEVQGLGDGVSWNRYIERPANLGEDLYGPELFGGLLSLDSCDGNDDEFECPTDLRISCMDFYLRGDKSYSREVRCDKAYVLARESGARSREDMRGDLPERSFHGSGDYSEGVYRVERVLGVDYIYYMSASGDYEIINAKRYCLDKGMPIVADYTTNTFIYSGHYTVFIWDGEEWQDVYEESITGAPGSVTVFSEIICRG